jgi:hypothetical protein
MWIVPKIVSSMSEAVKNTSFVLQESFLSSLNQNVNPERFGTCILKPANCLVHQVYG